MKWIKKGFIFKPNGEFDWSKEYAQIPRPLVLEDRIRVFYATRYYDSTNLPISQTSFVDLDKINLSKILYVHDKASLNLGEVDTFSEHGIHPTMLIRENNRTMLFYQGWKRLKDFPYETAIGIAESNDDGTTFKKTFENSIFQKSGEDIYFVNGVFIYKSEDKYVMYYSGGIKWIDEKGKKESVYVIKMAISNDLFQWKKLDRQIISEKSPDECQNTPCVIKIGDVYHMWFSHRPALNFREGNSGYRIGYAYSYDLINWIRDDLKSGICVSADKGWDSEMICYPYVFELEDKIIMLYCGNYFGKDGFGYAELDLNLNNESI